MKGKIIEEEVAAKEAKDAALQAKVDYLEAKVACLGVWCNG